MAHTGWKANFLINIGHGDPAALFKLMPRLSSADVCEVI